MVPNLRQDALYDSNQDTFFLLIMSQLVTATDGFIFPQVGDFYEAIGFDACVLVEYAGLNPFGGLRTDSIPRAGCPVMVDILHPIFIIS